MASTTETSVVPAAPAPAPPSPQPPPDSVSPRITLQYQTRQDLVKVAEIQRALQQRDGWRVSSPEQVLPDAVNRAEVYGGVRFFFEEDSVLARSVCEVIRQELAERGYEATFPLWPMVTLQRQGHFRARRGLIEVWISPLPSPITDADPNRMEGAGGSGFPGNLGSLHRLSQSDASNSPSDREERMRVHEMRMRNTK